MKKLRTALAGALLISMALLSVQAADADVKICINGEYVAFSDDYGYPYISEENRTMVPLAVTMQAAGAKVSWNQETQTATVLKGDTAVQVPIGQSYILVNGGRRENDAPARVVNGRTYLPIAVVLQSVGYNVEWEASTKTVFVSDATAAVKFDTYVPYSTSNWATLAKDLLEGNVVYYNGQYWATPEFANMIGNEEIVSYTDVSEGRTPEQQYVDEINANTQVTPSEKWVEVSALDKVASKIGIEKIMNGQSASASVSDIEILQYCMPSIPDNFVSNPVPGNYDGIQVKVENGKILLNESDLQNKGLL